MTGKPGSRTEEDAAFTELVGRQGPFLYRVAFSLLRNEADAEDAVQDALLKLYRSRSWLAMDEERAFLARTVWRVGLDRLASAEAKTMRNAEDVSAMQLKSAAKDPEEVAMETDERRLMRELISTLPEEFRQPLVLSAIEGMRSSEVAAVLGIPEGTVRTRVLRAKERLRETFQASLLTRGRVRTEVLP